MKTLTVAGQEYEKRDLSWYRYLPLSDRWMLELNTSHLLNALAERDQLITEERELSRIALATAEEKVGEAVMLMRQVNIKAITAVEVKQDWKDFLAAETLKEIEAEGKQAAEAIVEIDGKNSKLCVLLMECVRWYAAHPVDRSIKAKATLQEIELLAEEIPERKDG